MINEFSNEFKLLISKSAKLRGESRFTEAISLIEEKLPELEEGCLTLAYLEVFSAAEEMGDIEKAVNYAVKLAVYEPDLPSIQRYL